jgi:hypothetical protein
MSKSSAAETANNQNFIIAFLAAGKVENCF